MNENSPSSPYSPNLSHVKKSPDGISSTVIATTSEIATSTETPSMPEGSVMTTRTPPQKIQPSPLSSPSSSQPPLPDYEDEDHRGRYERRSYSPRSRSYSRPRSYSRSRSRSYSRSRSPPSYYERSRHYRPHRPPPLPPRHHHPHHHYGGDTYYGRSRYLPDHHHRSFSRRSRSPPLRRYRSRSPSRARPFRSNPDCRVYVGNLSYETRWTDLKDFMRKEAGPVVHADIMKSGSNRSLGCGTVEFEFPEDAQRAIRLLNDVEFMGRVIFLREDRTHDTRKDNYVAPDDCRLFVDNLPLTASWQDMKDLFRKAGRVLHTDITADPITRRPNGTGLVIFDDHRDARNAIEMFNDYEWQGHRLRVMEERSASTHLASSSSSSSLPPQSTTPTLGLPVSSGNTSSSTSRPPSASVPPPPPPPPIASSSASTPSQQPSSSINTSLPGLPVTDINSRDMSNGRSGHDALDGYMDPYYGNGSNYYGEGYYDDRYGEQLPPPVGTTVIPSAIPPPPPPPPPPSIASTAAAAAAAAGLPLFPSLVSGPGANLPSHGVNQIFVNKLPFATTSQDLIDLFRHVGPVVRSEILWYNGRPKGTGLVRFEDRITCERAIGKFNGYLYGGRKLDIRMDKYSTST